MQGRLGATLLSQDGLDPFTSPAPLLPKAAAATAPAATGVLGALSQSAAGKLVLLAFAATAGAGLHALWSKPVTKVVYVDRPVPAVSASSVVRALPSPAASPVEQASPPLAVSALGLSASDDATRSASARAQSLKAERAFLDVVRRTLSNGDAPGALARLSQYERSFARPKLSEECDVLRINVLVVSGSHAEARRAAATFRRKYPQSFLTPSVEAALAAMPTE
ncbi:MAG: hypothetical protein QM756_35460 [Polyangiaceae bacterium]